ncbi:melanoma-associated antigen B2-like [Pteronotus mesoamericanus]|uniref:melanoma-associated antigen B2-like n=1 Tax=Pteronotus mesoamericanus TaxID=1884717 RepID=UPI0023ED0B7D|nr:melanoma-associated antigen B2-like [Pteronotus parnellii mesoamericanus]
MPRGQKSKLRAREKRRQNRAETQSLTSAQATAGEEVEGACSSSSVLGDPSLGATGDGPLQAPSSAPATTSTTASVSCERSTGKAKSHGPKSKSSSQASTSTGCSGQDLLIQKASMLVEYLLYQYIMKEPVKKADMLKLVQKSCRKNFPEILRRTSEHMALLYGLHLKEVESNGNYYTLVDNQDDASDGSLSRGWRFPVRGILMPLLGVIFLNGNRASENLIWESLKIMGVYDGKSHFVFGEPRKLITQDLVQEKYLVYQQVPNSDPPRFEFLWGPKSLAETSKMKILEFLAKLNDNDPTVFRTHYEEALKDEEERAQARAQAESSAGCPSKASGHPTATSSHYSHPE